MGGTGKIIDELNKLMIKNKIKIVLNQDITHVNVKNNITGKKINSVEVLVRVASDNQNQN